jgi:hypothetical protein
MPISDKDYEMHVLLISKSRLKLSIGTSTLMAGFALVCLNRWALMGVLYNVCCFLEQVAMVEVDLEPGTPSAILVPYAMLTALLICVHLFSLVLATRLLPELEAYINNPNSNFPQPISITKGYSWPVQLVWYLSNIVGVLLFLVELVMVAYVKFFPQHDTASNRLHVGTATLAMVVTFSAIAIPFIVCFFRSLSNKKIKFHEQKLEKALDLFDSITRPREGNSGHMRNSEV